ncbi:hypothetical protein JTB14_008928 [Gonioctena quinquepunctata]|nr:hypothetical protein JTB14_008928 [Gonioctena quinquepunctata]
MFSLLPVPFVSCAPNRGAEAAGATASPNPKVHHHRAWHRGDQVCPKRCPPERNALPLQAGLCRGGPISSLAPRGNKMHETKCKSKPGSRPYCGNPYTNHSEQTQSTKLACPCPTKRKKEKYSGLPSIPRTHTGK